MDDEKWDDLKAPVREAGQGGQLNTFPEFSVAFWRWAIWKLFEADNAPQRGVIAFISNRKFLTGWPYAGLRKMMRERFDRIEIIDLRGDVRAGTRGDVDTDQGVFNIMVGTAITVAIADGSKAEGELADVTYVDCWQEGYFGRRAKLDWLLQGARQGTLPNSIPIVREALDDLKPAPFQNGEWISLRKAFNFANSGLQTKRDKFLYATKPEELIARLETFASAEPEVAREMFHDSRDRKWYPAQESLSDLNGKFEIDQRKMISVDYRPFDRRTIYNNQLLGDFLRPELQRTWGPSNSCFYTLPYGVGAGPALWCYGCLPDNNSFRGSYGGYAFPLYDRRIGPDASNIAPVLIASLGEAYGQPVAAEDIFDAILALLSAKSYTRLYAEDLEDVFPHIPFPATHAVFIRAVEIGREIRAVESFARDPAAAYRPPSFCRIASEPSGPVAAITYRDDAIALCEDGSGQITGIPQSVWDFSVSGYYVLRRWIDGRKGLPANLALMREFRDVAARIAELIHWFDSADIVLTDTLAHTLTREELGFPAPPQEDA